jgi:predicted ribosome quality control (RQC) complex YloA/Tae2 family protein
MKAGGGRLLLLVIMAAGPARLVHSLLQIGRRQLPVSRYLSIRKLSGAVRCSRITFGSERRFSSSSTHLFMATVDEDETTEASKTADSTWNLPGLKKEVQRLVMRCHKKVGKANERLKKANELVDELATKPDASLEDLEKCPNLEVLEVELRQIQDRLKSLNSLEESLTGIKGKSGVVLPEEAVTLALSLGVDDAPPRRPERGAPKPKGPRSGTKGRLPYRRYYSFKSVEIRVGKQAEDNDQLTLSPEHRDGTDWWMHASGCPGSHVVIRSSDQNLPEELVMDAAALAARQSKCTGKSINVSMTRCRDIAKPPGAKAGLVQLVGNVRTVTVNMKEAEARLKRLDATVLVN